MWVGKLLPSCSGVRRQTDLPEHVPRTAAQPSARFSRGLRMTPVGHDTETPAAPAPSLPAGGGRALGLRCSSGKACALSSQNLRSTSSCSSKATTSSRRTSR